MRPLAPVGCSGSPFSPSDSLHTHRSPLRLGFPTGYPSYLPIALTSVVWKMRAIQEFRQNSPNKSETSISWVNKNSGNNKTWLKTVAFTLFIVFSFFILMNSTCLIKKGVRKIPEISLLWLIISGRELLVGIINIIVSYCSKDWNWSMVTSCTYDVFYKHKVKTPPRSRDNQNPPKTEVWWNDWKT